MAQPWAQVRQHNCGRVFKCGNNRRHMHVRELTCTALWAGAGRDAAVCWLCCTALDSCVFRLTAHLLVIRIWISIVECLMAGMLLQGWYQTCSTPASTTSTQPPSAKGSKKQRSKASGNELLAADANAGAVSAGVADGAIDQYKQQYRRSRFQQSYDTTLSRELMLKLDLHSISHLPKIKSVDLSIRAKDVLGSTYVSNDVGRLISLCLCCRCCDIWNLGKVPRLRHAC